MAPLKSKKITCKEIVTQLKSRANKRSVAGMARFGIKSENSEILGVSVYVLRDMAKRVEKNHGLAQQLWKSKIHEARMMAGFIDEPAKVTQRQMERWVKDFDSWDLCDQTCSNLFHKTPFYQYAFFRLPG